MIDTKYLRIRKTKSGEEVWTCGHCGQPAEDAKGAQNQDDLTYMLMCPTGKVTLGEWTTPEEKTKELAAYKNRLPN